MSKSPFRILFVCMGNICRSPAAEEVMRSMVRAAGLEDAVECDSAGTIGHHEGKPADSRMLRAAKARGFDLAGAARPVDRSDFQAFDLILTMDEENYRDVSRMAGSGVGSGAVRRFCDFLTGHGEAEIPDPYFGGNEGFERVLDLLENGCAELLRSIKDDAGHS